MPNAQNVRSPITLLGNGRSGTSLLSQAFAAHPDCSFHGETTNLIHTVSWAQSANLSPRSQAEIPRVIRSQFEQFFPSSEARWMHKPIGSPMCSGSFADKDEYLNWYWQVFDDIFPESKTFTIVRHPLDVLISSNRWWGRNFGQIAKSMKLTAQLALHPHASIGYSLCYENLVANPESELEALFAFVELPWNETCLQAFDTRHEASPVNDEIDNKNMWDAIPRSVLDDEFYATVGAHWSAVSGKSMPTNLHGGRG